MGTRFLTKAATVGAFAEVARSKPSISVIEQDEQLQMIVDMAEMRAE